MDRHEFFMNLDETLLLSSLNQQKVESQGTYFSSYRRRSNGFNYCIKLPKPQFLNQLLGAHAREQFISLINQLGRDPFPYLPPMMAGQGESYQLWIIMPWGVSVRPPSDISKTLTYIEKTYHITLQDMLQCHQSEDLIFLSDWSDLMQKPTVS